VGDLGKRLLSALIFGPVVVAFFVFLPPAFFLVFLGIIFILAAYELVTMARLDFLPVIIVLAGLSLLPLYAGRSEAYVLWLLFAPALYLFFRLLIRRSESASINSELARSVAVLLISQVFLAFPLFSLYRLKEFGRYVPLLLVLIIWASDTGAYLLGKSIGKRKLAPLVSPKKTFEGLAGAIAGAIIVTLLFKNQLGLTGQWAALVGLAIGALGQLGDIMESIGKRMWEVKDSSSLIPGHGGILDRIDSLILTAPFMYYCLSGLNG
jgi:phosphatidate cytidylyltransferase